MGLLWPLGKGERSPAGAAALRLSQATAQGCGWAGERGEVICAIARGGDQVGHIISNAEGHPASPGLSGAMNGLCLVNN